MATYIQGVTDYIPQIQPFTPDYNFYNKALEFKQSKYDTALKDVNNVYGSLLNAPLTREDNSEMRDQFFKTIEQDIHKIAGSDLSLNQNSSAAKGIFNQLTDNKNIVNDMVFTKNSMSAKQRALSFKNCLDPKKCGGSYWEGGERLIDYQIDAFKNATADQAMGMRSADFVASQNLTEAAMKLAKEANLNVTETNIAGQWIVTNKNGASVVGKLADLFRGALSQDPKMKAYYDAKSKLARKDYMYSNKDKYGSLEMAEQAYIHENMPMLQKFYSTKADRLKERQDLSKHKAAKLDEGMKNTLPEERTELKKIRDAYRQNEKLYEASAKTTEIDANNLIVGYNNQQFTGAQVDAMLSGINLNSDINNAAKVLAYKNASTSIKANPYEVERIRQRNRVRLAHLKNTLSGTAAKKSNNEKIAEAQASGKRIMQTSNGDIISEDDIALDENGEPQGEKVISPNKSILELKDNKVLVTTKKADGSVTTEITKKSDYKKALDKYETDAEKELKQHGGDSQWKPVPAPAQATSDADQDKNKEEETIDSDSYNQYQKEYTKKRIDVAYNERVITKDVLTTISNAAEQGDIGAKEDYVNIMRTLHPETTWDAKYAGALNPYIAKYTTPKIPLQAVPFDESLEKEYQQLKKRFPNFDKLDDATLEELYVSQVSDLLDMTKVENRTMRPHLKNVWNKHKNGMRSITTKNNLLATTDKWVADKSQDVLKQIKGLNEDQRVALDVLIDESGHELSYNSFVKKMTEKGYNPVRIEELYEGKMAVDNNQHSMGFYAEKAVLGPGLAAKVFLREREDFTDLDDPDLAFIEDGKPISQIWREGFTKYITPAGQSAFSPLIGAGNMVGRSIYYPSVDVEAIQAPAYMGSAQLIKNVLSDKSNIIVRGSLGNVPDRDDVDEEKYEKDKVVLQTLLDDMTQYGKDGIPKADFSIEYTRVAGGDPTMIGFNIKLNKAYADKHKGTKDLPGVMRDTKLQTEGISGYMKLANANDEFTDQTTYTDFERALLYAGEAPFDIDPEYTRNFKVVPTKAIGVYKITGDYAVVNTETGKLDWRNDYVYDNNSGNDLDESIKAAQLEIQRIVNGNAARKAAFLNKNK